MSCWNKQQDTGWARVNKNIPGKENQQGAQSKPGSRPLRTYLRGAPRSRPFKYIQIYNCMIAHMKKIAMNFCNMLPVCYYDISYPRVELLYNADWCLFSQVINKPWLLWVYSWIRHRFELPHWNRNAWTTNCIQQILLWATKNVSFSQKRSYFLIDQYFFESAWNEK